MTPGVLIAGAGPVGLTMAAELARYGLSVRIIDPAPTPTDKSKALVVWSRTLEHLDRMGIARNFIAAGHPVHHARISGTDKELADVDLSHVDSPYPYALMIPQSEIERLLSEHLKSLGIEVERTVKLTAFAAVEDTVSCTLTRADGSSEAVTPAWLIGCDGAHSVVRHTLGMSFEGDTLPSDWMLADLHLTGPGIDAESIAIHLHHDGVFALFPMGGTRFRVLADITAKAATDQTHAHPDATHATAPCVPPSASASASEAAAKAGLVPPPGIPDPTLADTQALLEHRGFPGVTASDPVWLANFHINERKVADFRRGRIFLAGDAAHIDSPAGGQGMNTGMQDAINLAWKLALVHNNAAKPEPLLASYSIERSAVGEQVLKDAGNLTRMAILQQPLLKELRDHILPLVFGVPAVRNIFAEKMTELAIAYPHSPLTASHLAAPKPAPGQRAPMLDREGASLPPVSTGPTPRFTLFAEPTEAATALLTRLPTLLDSELRAPFHPGALHLIRPDGYVSVATHNAADIETFLASLT